jgi:hypothetical protein
MVVAGPTSDGEPGPRAERRTTYPGQHLGGMSTGDVSIDGMSIGDVWVGDVWVGRMSIAGAGEFDPDGLTAVVRALDENGALEFFDEIMNDLQAAAAHGFGVTLDGAGAVRMAVVHAHSYSDAIDEFHDDTHFRRGRGRMVHDVRQKFRGDQAYGVDRVVVLGYPPVVEGVHDPAAGPRDLADARGGGDDPAASVLSVHCVQDPLMTRGMETSGAYANAMQWHGSQRDGYHAGDNRRAAS